MIQPVDSNRARATYLFGVREPVASDHLAGLEARTLHTAHVDWLEDGRFLVIWHGTPYGAPFLSYTDAEACAEHCEGEPAQAHAWQMGRVA